MLLARKEFRIRLFLWIDGISEFHSVNKRISKEGIVKFLGQIGYILLLVIVHVYLRFHVLSAALLCFCMVVCMYGCNYSGLLPNSSYG